MQQKAIRILMIDDDEEDFIIIRDTLSEIKNETTIIDWSPSYKEGLKVIAEKKHDVCLVDYRLGAEVGTTLIKEAIAKGCEAPLILLTGQNDVETDQQALNAGAADYLIKGSISAGTLERSIRYSIAQAKNLAEIKRLNEDLELRVKSRTLILEEAVVELNKTKEELHIALQKEMELNELKSRFVSMASHEFRTPLAAIRSSLSLISKYGEIGDKEKQEKHTERIKSSITHLTDILNDILSLSKLEEGRTNVMVENFHIDEFFSEVVMDMQEIAKPGQEIMYQHSGKNEVSLDKKILRHILLNLISNAIKFSPENENIRVKSEADDAYLKFSVADSGIGISEEDQKHLFERFFRARNAADVQGTGLGLNIVSKYVELMRGEIHLKSELSAGTTFFVVLPRVLDKGE